MNGCCDCGSGCMDIRYCTREELLEMEREPVREFTVESLISCATAGMEMGYMETYQDVLDFLKDIRDDRGLNISEGDLERMCAEILRRGGVS